MGGLICRNDFLGGGLFEGGLLGVGAYWRIYGNAFVDDELLCKRNVYHKIMLFFKCIVSNRGGGVRSDISSNITQGSQKAGDTMEKGERG